MKKLSILLAAVSVLLLGSGCSAGTEAQSSPTTAASTPTQSATSSSAATITVSEKAICTQLVGPKEDGPLIEYINGITTVDATDSAAIAELSATRTEIQQIAIRADSELRTLVNALFSEDVNDFKAAGVELLTRCA
jgi:hypothetical protein